MQIHVFLVQSSWAVFSDLAMEFVKFATFLKLNVLYPRFPKVWDPGINVRWENRKALVTVLL